MTVFLQLCTQLTCCVELQLPTNTVETNTHKRVSFIPSRILLGLVENDTIVLLLEPLHGFLASHLVRVAKSASLSLSLRHATTGASQLHVEIHTEDTGVGVVLDTQINVLLNTETEVARVREVLLHQLVLLHLQTALQNLQSLLAANGSMDGDLLVTTDGEGTDGETSYTLAAKENAKIPFP